MLVCEAIDFGRTLAHPSGTKTKYNLKVEANGSAMLESGSVVNVISADGTGRRVIIGATQKITPKKSMNSIVVYGQTLMRVYEDLETQIKQMENVQLVHEDDIDAGHGTMVEVFVTNPFAKAN